MKIRGSQENLLVALDIGTTKICALVGKKVNDNEIDILGIGKAPSYGVSKGTIVDISQAAYAVRLAIKEAEIMSGCKIENVIVGISGSHIQSLNSNGMVTVKGERIKESDIASVISAAKAVAVPEGQQVLHVLPQYYIIDGTQKILDPIGMFGLRLETKAHIITGSVSSVKNIIKCCQMAGLNVLDVILEPLASADAVISKDERELGVGLLDIGGGTSDFVIYQNRTIRHTKVLSIAGNHFTNDIALCLQSTIKDSERLKREFGKACFEYIQNPNLDLEIEMVQGNRTKLIKITELVSVIEPRAVELISLIEHEIETQNLSTLMPAGLVLTGGGSLLSGLDILASSILRCPVRVGYPKVPQICKDSIDSPIYATTYGLLLFFINKSKQTGCQDLTESVSNRILWRMKSWFAEFF